MKLLHIGCNVGTESLPKYFSQACDYDELPLNRELKERLQTLDYIPDRIFIQIQSDTIDGVNTCQLIGNEIKSLKDAGARVINWTGDLRRETPHWMFEFAKNVSITGFSNMRDVNTFSARFPAVFLQQGIDTDIYTPEGDTVECPDIVFMANNYGNQFPLSRFRRECVLELRNKFRSFGVYGNGWNDAAGNLNHDQREEAKYYRGAKIAISVSHFDVDRYFSDRLGRALCTGAFVLSHHYRGIEKDFKLGYHLDTFKDTRELRAKCDHYLSRKKEREDISYWGAKMARKSFSYEQMVKEILEL